MRLRRLLPAVLAAVAVVVLGTAVPGLPPARADVVPLGDTLRPGQTFEGDVPPGEPLRIGVELAKGAKLRLKFSLRVTGPARYLPANFQRVSVIGPDGSPVPFNATSETSVRYLPSSRTSVFWTKDWPAPKGGVYTFTITHRTTTMTRCKGTVKAIRPRTIRVTGDENTTAFLLPLQPADAARVSVKTLTGTTAYLAQYVPPGQQFGYEPAFTLKKRVAKLRSPLFATAFGEAILTIGYLDDAAPAGTWKATVTVRPPTRYSKVGLYVGLPVDVPLQVRNEDGYTDVPWAGSGGVVGVSFDGSYTLVTAESNGAVLAKLYNANLTDPGPFANPVQLASSADLPGNVSVLGHRIVFLDGFHYVAFASATGANAAVVRWPAALTARQGFSPVVDGATGPVNDLFLATDGLAVSVGVPVPPYQHDVYRFNATTLAPTGGGPVRIGDPVRPILAGSSAAYRFDQDVFELWSPTAVTSVPGDPSDLQHALYSPGWGLAVWDGALVADPAVTETMCSSVVVDPRTGATIVHYIEPSVDASGLGRLHRVLFDAAGAKIRDSEAVIGVARRNRPAACISGGYLWLATQGATSPNVTRYQLLQD